MKKLIQTILILVSSLQLQANVQLPKLFSEGAVLQRNEEIKIWGWAEAGEQISIEFVNSTFQTTADKKGNWSVTVDPHPAGGPFELSVSGQNKLTVSDIYFGDVWLASGQSNMELTMSRVKEKFPDEVNNADFPLIRQFEVPDNYHFTEKKTDLESGKWKQANVQNIEQFSAVAYFFAKELHQKEKVPVGIINSALGGSPVESWMSEKALKNYTDAYEELQKFKDQSFRDSIAQADEQRNSQWYEKVNKIDKGLDGEGNPRWARPDYNDSDWKTTEIPGYWAQSTEIGQKNGVVWFRKEVNVPEKMVGKKAVLWLGRLVDQDYAYINGTLVGTTGYQYPPRIYYFEDDILKKGKNTIAVRLINNSGQGGFVKKKPYFLATEEDTLDLRGTWKYKLGGTMKPLSPPTFIRWKPSGLYNAMIHPLTKFHIKGVIWYQGESNTGQPEKYQERFASMIQQWRTDWNRNLPFYFVQLANFMQPATQPEESNWAQLREAQRNTLDLENTGMAVAIDLGEATDIHPLDKETVGKRLANLALDKTYNYDISSESPEPESVKFKSSKAVIRFANEGEKLISDDGQEIRYVTISADGEKFVWAKSKLKGNKLIVWHKDINKPVAVRYAWANNPENVNLYSTNGLPVSPFQVTK